EALVEADAFYGAVCGGLEADAEFDRITVHRCLLRRHACQRPQAGRIGQDDRHLLARGWSLKVEAVIHRPRHDRIGAARLDVPAIAPVLAAGGLPPALSAIDRYLDAGDATAAEIL